MEVSAVVVRIKIGLNSDMSYPRVLSKPDLFMEKSIENVLNWPHFLHYQIN